MKEAIIATSLQRRKRILFSAFLCLLPLLVFVLLEAALRMFDYDDDLSLVVKTISDGRQFYQINRSVGRRFFTQNDPVIPEPHDDRFLVNKGPHIKRIFCVGESTMEGFPYEFNATPPYLLRDRLELALPEDTVEVVNVGLSAVGSYVILDFVKELLQYQPDLFIVYLGHNEFYGAYGPGSNVTGGTSPWLTRLNIALLHFKTYLLLRDTYAAITALFHTPQRGETGTLMKQMVGKGELPYHGPVYYNCMKAYEQNLNAIIEEVQSRDVPIIFSELVSNLRNQPPFVSLHADNLPDSARRAWQNLMDQADSLERTRDTLAAVFRYQTATAIDTLYADGYYRLGSSLFSCSRYRDALQAFRRAKDLDALRFRASTEFTHVLSSVCRSHGVPLARVDSAFASASPGGIIGHELILEHLHPNIEGYRLMAKVWEETIRRNGLLGAPDHWHAEFPDSVFTTYSAVTAFDDTLGALKARLLMRHWPFNASVDVTISGSHDPVSTVCVAFLEKKISWSEARYQLAEQYARVGQYGPARNECLAVSKVIPYSYQPLLRVADYYVDEGRERDAEEAYRRCIGVEENPFAHMKLGLVLMKREDPTDAAAEIERGFAVDKEQGGKLNANASAMGRYLLGVAYANTQMYDKARENLERALAIKPDLHEAQQVLQQLSGGTAR